MSKWLNFGGDPDRGSQYRNTGKTCLGGGMHCPITSSLRFVLQLLKVLYCLLYQ